MKSTPGLRATSPQRALTVSIGALFILLPALLPAFAAGPYPYMAADRPDALALLPPPPRSGSSEQAADLALAVSIFSGRTQSEEAAAKAEEKPNIFLFAPAIGADFQAGRFPKTEALLNEVQKEILAVVVICKTNFQRPRPYQADQRLSLGRTVKSFSYPSYHSTFGTVEGALLAELFPQRAAAILETGRNLGWHRVLMGEHYPTDIYAGRVLGQAIVRELKTSAVFQHDFAECATEVASGNLIP